MKRPRLLILAPTQLQWLFGISTSMALCSMIFLTWIGKPLTTPPVCLPWGLNDGILALEFAGKPAVAQNLIDCWQGKLAVRAGISIGFDFCFIGIYIVALSSGCLWGANFFLLNSKLLVLAGELLAWGGILAGMFDLIENVALIRQLLFGAASPWTEIAWSCACVKFVLIILCLIYLFVSLTALGVLLLKIRFIQKTST